MSEKQLRDTVAMVRKMIEDATIIRDGGGSGCIRRAKWSDEKSWRRSRGNALLAVVGRKWTVKGPLGPCDFYCHGDHMLTFRGGPWKQYWIEDVEKVWGLVESTGFKLSPSALVIHENRGLVNIVEVQINEERARRAFREQVDGARKDPPGRVAKNTPYAYNICRFCPVRQRCDSIDKLRNETLDWGPSYDA